MRASLAAMTTTGFGYGTRPVYLDRAIYTTITVMTILIVYDGWQTLKLRAAVGVILGPALAIFVAHVFSASLARQAELRSVFLSARRRAGLSDRFRVHDLRHTAASLMIQAGYPPKMLQEIMGHASITTTLDLYGHLYPGEMDRYADRLNEAAGMTDAAKMRPDGTDDEGDPEGSTR
jgi:integrase